MCKNVPKHAKVRQAEYSKTYQDLERPKMQQNMLKCYTKIWLKEY